MSDGFLPLLTDVVRQHILQLAKGHVEHTVTRDKSREGSPTQENDRQLRQQAREELCVGLPEEDRQKAMQLLGMKVGVFVTIRKEPGKKLRGCIGFIEPQVCLAEAIQAAAEGAVNRDPRFPTVEASELGSLLVSVSLLGTSTQLTGSSNDYSSQISIGTHGLIVQNDLKRGLLLPQVAVDNGLDPETFLDWTCRKAGLPMSDWKQESTVVKKFPGIEIE